MSKISQLFNDNARRWLKDFKPEGYKKLKELESEERQIEQLGVRTKNGIIVSQTYYAQTQKALLDQWNLDVIEFTLEKISESEVAWRAVEARMYAIHGIATCTNGTDTRKAAQKELAGLMSALDDLETEQGKLAKIGIIMEVSELISYVKELRKHTKTYIITGTPEAHIQLRDFIKEHDEEVRKHLLKHVRNQIGRPEGITSLTDFLGAWGHHLCTQENLSYAAAANRIINELKQLPSLSEIQSIALGELEKRPYGKRGDYLKKIISRWRNKQ